MTDLVSVKSALSRARALCAKQERCRSELRAKLDTWGIPEKDGERLLAQLEKEGFLNEGRFAEHYAVSKLRQNGWGRVKIRFALKQRGIGGPHITEALAALDPAEYSRTLQTLIRKQLAREKGRARLEGRQRVIRHMIARGFEADLVREALQA